MRTRLGQKKKKPKDVVGLIKIAEKSIILVKIHTHGVIEVVLVTLNSEQLQASSNTDRTDNNILKNSQ